MNGLILDTSTERGIAAIFTENKMLIDIRLPLGLQSSDQLLPVLEQKLKKEKFSLKNLNYIVLGMGPGSYTGIRVAASIAKMLSFVYHLPLIGISSLEGFIPQKNEDSKYGVLVDAKIGGVYMMKAEIVHGRKKSLISPQLCSLDEALKALSDANIIVTPNSKVLRSKLEATTSKISWQWQENYPEATIYHDMALQKVQAGDYFVEGGEEDAPTLQLLYLRKTQAEIEKEGR